MIILVYLIIFYFLGLFWGVYLLFVVNLTCARAAQLVTLPALLATKRTTHPLHLDLHLVGPDIQDGGDSELEEGEGVRCGAPG